MESDDSDTAGGRRRRKRDINGVDQWNGEGSQRRSITGSVTIPFKRKRESDVDESDEDSDDDEQVNGHSPELPRSQVNGHSQELPRTSRPEKGKGRASMNGHSHANGDHEPDEEEGEDEQMDQPVMRAQYRPEYERHPDGYVTGSITRIKLIDFMTYDFVEFHPGPHLNMILGPNGTGKSTIAAGIAIGLGFGPQVMGRATNVKSYIKKGKEGFCTEIEIRGKPGKRNYVISRQHSRDKGNEWKLNGQKETKENISALVATFGIQANNLCCFLPQDRVAEFAKMSPPLTLKETMRAAGNPRLTEWHDHLVRKGTEKKVLDEKVLSDTSRRDQLQGQVDRLAPEVEHYENRKAQEFQREVMELAVEFARANEAKILAANLKTQEEQVLQQSRALTAKRKPLEDLHAFQQKRKNKAAEKVEDKKKALNESARDVSKYHGRLQDKLDEAGQADAELETLKRRIKRMEQDKDRQLKKIEQAEELLSHPRDEIVRRLGEQTNRKREEHARSRQAEQKKRDLQERKHMMETDLRNIDNGINDKMKRQRELGDVERIRTEKAIRMNGSIGFALDWLKDHAHELEHPVMQPPCISVNVPDKRYAWQIEQSMNFAQRSTFICQSRNDYDTMMRLNNRRYPARTLSNGDRVEGGIVSLHLVFLTPNDRNVNMPPPCSLETMRNLGIDGWATKFVEAEPAVIAFLNEQCGFSRTALTQRPSIEGAQVGEAGFVAWLTREESFRGQRSRYGRRAFQFSSQPARPAGFLNLSVDQQAIAALGTEVAELKRRKVDSEQPLQQLSEELATVSTSLRGIEAKEADIETAIKAIRSEITEHDNAKHSLELAQKELQRLADRPTESAERDRLRAEKLKKALACLPIVSNLIKHHDVGETEAANSVSAGLSFAQASKDLSVIEKKRDSGSDEMTRLEELKKTLKERKTKALARFNDTYARVQEQLSRRSRPVREEFKKRAKDPQYKDMSVEECEAELAHVTAELEISEGINPSVIERYKRLSAELEDIVKAVGAQEGDLQKINRSIDTILTKFLPALDSLVSSVSAKFSAAFDREGRSGDVRLDKDERGYEHWGLIPHVSFRDNEAMQPLTGHRQSGGERSYSTIMYLMALSEMARVPFSLVDEINQGMDQQAERTVFNQLVETTCDAGAGQYFLITPKLLTGLKYHERMKVLIVNNGYWLPEGTDKTQKFGDIRGCLKRYRTSLAAH